jgi:hypothetical protein
VFPPDPNRRITSQAGIELFQCSTHLSLYIRNKPIRFEGQIQRLIIRCALRREFPVGLHDMREHSC